MASITSVILTGLLVLISYGVYKINQIPPVPTLDNVYWGAGEPKPDDNSVIDFRIKLDDRVLTLLKSRLDNARPFTPPLEGVNFEYGFNSDTLAKIVEYWKTEYDWRKREDFLNKYPQFLTKVQGLVLHFIHVKPVPKEGVKVIPLLMMHGWPGSVREFYEIIPMLITPRPDRDFVFEVVVPSLPGYAFSQAAAKPGMGAAQVAVIMKNLMGRLGFEKFYVQGGDWGGVIATNMATLFPKNILGLHSNMCFVRTLKSTLLTMLESIYPPWFVDEEFSHKVYPMGKNFARLLEETGYFHIQATKPDTIGFGLNDSPVGLAAYILEKFSTGTNNTYKYIKDGGLLEKYSYDDLLDNVMLYWVTNSFTTSARLYAETASIAQMNLKLLDIPISADVPCACMVSPYEIAYHPDHILKLKYTNLIQSTKYKIGGHFAALENPKMLADDMWLAYYKMQNLKSA